MGSRLVASRGPPAAPRVVPAASPHLGLGTSRTVTCRGGSPRMAAIRSAPRVRGTPLPSRAGCRGRNEGGNSFSGGFGLASGREMRE